MMATLASAFGLLAIVLVCIGLYGLLSYTVARRTKEIGIRMALGAERRTVLKMVLREGMLLTTVGIGVGLALGVVLTRLISSQLYNLSATDPTTFTTVSLFLTFVVLAASYLPARRATRVDPLVALRYE
jgi:ABC-type antimicrobial peptide transport system permease subunit